MPGLVDAHCHIGLDDHGGVSDEETEAQAILDRDGGALLIRDCGTGPDTSWIHERDDLPRLIRAGRHIARTQRYIRNYAHEVEPDALVEHVVREAQRSDGWVKLVGDWISRDAGDLAPSFPADAFAAAIAAAHDHGAKVTAHCFGTSVLPGLIEAGIDCIEHGNGLTSDLIDAMVAHGTALVPTVMQTAKFPDYAEAGRERFPDYSRTMDELSRGSPHVLMQAYEAGCRSTPAPTAGVWPPRQHRRRGGRARGDGAARRRCLGAASWRAREWLGWNPGLVEGAPADFVVYPRNPLEDVSVR